MSNIEIIDDITGEWRTVTMTNPSNYYRTNKDGKPEHFFPLADKPKCKVAKVRIFNNSKFFWYEIRKFNGADVLGDNRKSKASALRGARRFCKAIGYEMEVVK